MDFGATLSQSSQVPDASVRNRDSHGLTPVTVKQVSEASQAGDEKSSFSIRGLDATNVTVVGIVLDKEEKVTDVSFTLDDGTGRIRVKRWINESFDTSEMEVILDGMYVRVNGHLRVSQGVKQILAFSARPVTNFDEVTFHFIECIHSHLQNSKFQPHQMETKTNTVLNIGSNECATPISNQVSSDYGVDGLKGMDQLVLNCLRQSSDTCQEKGMHVDDVRQQLRVSLDKIRESLRLLEDEGLIYSTIDENHYKAT